jgi:steroid 5-alpha reductase family enzyme
MSAGSTNLINIGPKETRKRLLIGVVMIAVSAVLAVVLSYGEARRAWIFLLFVPFWMATLSLSQARKKT